MRAQICTAFVLALTLVQLAVADSRVSPNQPSFEYGRDLVIAYSRDLYQEFDSKSRENSNLVSESIVSGQVEVDVSSEGFNTTEVIRYEGRIDDHNLMGDVYLQHEKDGRWLGLVWDLRPKSPTVQLVTAEEIISYTITPVVMPGQLVQKLPHSIGAMGVLFPEHHEIINAILSEPSVMDLLPDPLIRGLGIGSVHNSLPSSSILPSLPPGWVWSCYASGGGYICEPQGPDDDTDPY